MAPQAGDSLGVTINSRDRKTQFANVDLDLRVRGDLSPVIAALGERVLVIHQDKSRGRHWVRLSLVQPRSPEHAIRKLAVLLAGLPPSARRTLKKAKKELDIGIEGGNDPASAEWVLSPDVIAAVAALGAQVRITVYSASLAAVRQT